MAFKGEYTLSCTNDFVTRKLVWNLKPLDTKLLLVVIQSLCTLAGDNYFNDRREVLIYVLTSKEKQVLTYICTSLTYDL